MLSPSAGGYVSNQSIPPPVVDSLCSIIKDCMSMMQEFSLLIKDIHLSRLSGQSRYYSPRRYSPSPPRYRSPSPRRNHRYSREHRRYSREHSHSRDTRHRSPSPRPSRYDRSSHDSRYSSSSRRPESPYRGRHSSRSHSHTRPHSRDRDDRSQRCDPSPPSLPPEKRSTPSVSEPPVTKPVYVNSIFTQTPITTTTAPPTKACNFQPSSFAIDADLICTLSSQGYNIKQCQQDDPDLSLVISWVENGSRPQRFTLPKQSHVSRRLWLDFHKLNLVDGILCRHYQPSFAAKRVNQVIIPTSLQPTVLAYLHSNSSCKQNVHMVIKQSLKVCYWPNIRNDVTKYCQTFHQTEITCTSPTQPKVRTSTPTKSKHCAKPKLYSPTSGSGLLPIPKQHLSPDVVFLHSPTAPTIKHSTSTYPPYSLPISLRPTPSFKFPPTPIHLPSDRSR